MNLRALLLLLSAAMAGVAAPTAAEIAQQARTPSLDPAACYHVRDLSLDREDLKLYFNEGYLIFSKPLNGERISAVFYGDMEGGDGEVLLLPPFRGERMSLARFTQSPNLDEHFREAVLVFSDGSASTLIDRITKDGRGQPAPDQAAFLIQEWDPSLANFESGFELRMVEDLLTPQPGRPGMFFAALAGKKLGNFDVFYDRRANNQIGVGRQETSDRRSAYDIWTGFPSRGFRNGTAKPLESQLAEKKFQIDASLDANLALKATVGVSFTIGRNELRALSFEVSTAMQVLSAKIDGQPAEILASETAHTTAVGDTENISFLVIPASPLAPATTHQIEFQEQGSVIKKAGNDVYFVAARTNWYPRATAGLALYDLTFRYPSRLTLVTSGDVTEDHVDGAVHVTRRVSPVPIRLAGFNLGEYEKASVAAAGVHVDVYGNRGVELALQPKSQMVESPPPVRPPVRRGVPAPPVLTERSAAPPNPIARLQAVAADVSSALRFFSGLFGPPPLKTLTVAPIPGTFGQGFPGLVYLSTLSYLDPTQRPEGVRGPREQVFFSTLMEAHEVAHQWWGNAVMPNGYQDEWLSEALANYSALLFLEKQQGTKAMEDVLQDYRDELMTKDSSGATVESSGPITWGFRLDGTGNLDAWHHITYYKGAWILHMLRERMGDDRFLKMLGELRRRYDSRTLSTAQFEAVVKDFVPSRSSALGGVPLDVDEFFENWVYGTGIPELKLAYSARGSAAGVRVSGTVTQTGVEDGFSAQVPVEIRFAKAPSQILWVETSKGETTFSKLVQQTPVKVAIPEGRILAAKK